MQQAREGTNRPPVRLQPVALRPVDPASVEIHRRTGFVSPMIEASLWLLRLLFVQPVGRRAREDRLRSLSEGTLRDLGLLRADAQAAAWGMVPLQEVLPPYPSGGPLFVCGGRGHPLTLVRMNEAA